MNLTSPDRCSEDVRVLQVINIGIGLLCKMSVNRISMVQIASELSPQAVAKLGFSAGNERDSPQGSTGGSISQFHSAALKGSYGRLCLILALDLSLGVPGLVNEKDLEEALNSVPREVLKKSPDLMRRLLAVRLGGGQARPPEDRFLTLVTELRTFAVYRSVFPMEQAATPEVAADEASARSRDLVFWRDAIWAVMAELDNVEAATKLKDIWTPRIWASANPPPVRLRPSRANPRLEALYRVMDTPWRPSESNVVFESTGNATLADVRAVHSPWMGKKNYYLPTAPKRRTYYPIEFMYLVCAVTLDIRILVRLEDCESQIPFILHILSTIDELQDFRAFNVEDAQSRNASPEESEVGILCKAALQISIATLDGDGGKPAVSRTIEVVENACRQYDGLPGSGNPHIDRNKKDQTKWKLSAATLRLVESGMSSRGKSTASRWLTHAKAVAELHAEVLPRPTDQDRYEFALRRLIFRFLVPSTDEARWLDTTVLTDIKKQGWSVSHRNLLLAPVSSVADWDLPGAQKPSKERGQLIILVRAVQRVAAARRDPRCNSELRARWRDDLRGLLRQTTGLINFDRFFRASLVKLLEDGDVEGDNQRRSSSTLTQKTLRGFPSASSSSSHATSAAPRCISGITWLVGLARGDGSTPTAKERADATVMLQVEGLEAYLHKLGTVHNRAFSAREKTIREGLATGSNFEDAQVLLGKHLGFEAGKKEEDASPDPWWRIGNIALVFEDHANAGAKAVIDATKARQAASHPDWLREHVPDTAGATIQAVLVTPVEKAKKGAMPHLSRVAYWGLNDFRNWAVTALDAVRELRRNFVEPGDLAWRAAAAQKLEEIRADAPSLSKWLSARPAKKHLTEVS